MGSFRIGPDYYDCLIFVEMGYILGLNDDFLDESGRGLKPSDGERRTASDESPKFKRMEPTRVWNYPLGEKDPLSLHDPVVESNDFRRGRLAEVDEVLICP